MSSNHTATPSAGTAAGGTPLADIVEQSLAAASPGAQTEILILRQHLGLTRYSGKRIHQSVEDLSERIWVRSWAGGGMGWASTGDATAAGLTAAVEQAEANSQLVASAEPVPLPDRADPTGVATFFAATAGTGAAARSEIAAGHIERAGDIDINANLRVAVQEMALGNTQGLSVALPLTYAALNAIARTSDGATWYETAIGRDIAALDLDATIDAAVAGARAAALPLPIPPGDYPIVIDPPAISMLLVSLGYVGLNVFGATAAREGASYIAENLGQSVAAAGFTLTDEPLDPVALATPFDAEGTPHSSLTIIDRGVAAAVAHDLTSAATDGTGTTGHALPAGMKGPAPISLSIPSGTDTRAQLIAGLGDGLVVHRIHPFVSLRGGPHADLSGTTRDGVLVIRGGEIAGAATNVRWSNTMTDLFGSVDAASVERSVQWMDLPDHAPHTNHLPSLRCQRFTVHGSQPRE
jgi:predicted Zn-dependent protease